jgi:shikimate dehydrogenase
MKSGESEHQMKTYGLIGYPLSHSFSKKYFSEKFEKENIENCRYNNYSIESVGLITDILKKDKTLAGFNVTIPYKEEILKYLHELDDDATEIGAVNTIKVLDGGRKLKGFNTDAWGFAQSIKPYLNETHKAALILGTGGASKAVEYVLKKEGIKCLYVSRNPGDHRITYSELNEKLMHEHTVIVNCSPLGMYPHTESYPGIPYEFIGRNHLLYDLIYNPPETAFMKKGKENGAVTVNGLKMLHLQAEKAWEIWNNESS